MIKILKYGVWIYKYGFVNAYLKIKYKLQKKNRQQLNRESITNTSISDSALYINYPSFCATAAENEKVFHEFRTYNEIVQVLDHVSIEQASGYIEEILRYSNWEKDFTNTLNTLDSLGKPYRYKFKFGNFSTTSIRYLKTYLEIKNLFGNLDHYNIQEIGVGFGGQASIFIMLPIRFLYFLRFSPYFKFIEKIYIFSEFNW